MSRSSLFSGKPQAENRLLALFVENTVIAENTFYKWRQKFGGLEISDARRLRELEQQTARLKRLLAERDLEIDAMKELLAKKF